MSAKERERSRGSAPAETMNSDYELRLLATRPQQRAQEVVVSVVHLPVAVDVHPPSAAHVVVVTGAEFRLEPEGRGPVHLQELEPTVLRQIRQDDGVIEEVLARDVDDGAGVGRRRVRSRAWSPPPRGSRRSPPGGWQGRSVFSTSCLSPK